nr:hypothetical protein Itr_chr01CG07090 [Ipomoea trifida]
MTQQRWRSSSTTSKHQATTLELSGGSWLWRSRRSACSLAVVSGGAGGSVRRSCDSLSLSLSFPARCGHGAIRRRFPPPSVLPLRQAEFGERHCCGFGGLR